jgi:hypothetical protein
MSDAFKANSVAGFDWLTREGKQTLKELCDIPVLSVGSEVGKDIKKVIEQTKDSLGSVILGLDPIVAQMRLVWECQDITGNKDLSWNDLISDTSTIAMVKEKYPSGLNQIQTILKLLEIRDRLKAVNVALNIIWHE